MFLGVLDCLFLLYVAFAPTVRRWLSKDPLACLGGISKPEPDTE
jgi:hypothetical protein